MNHNEMVDLIRDGVIPGSWADFGAGTGNFTAALRDLIDAQSTIYAVDRDPHALSALQRRLPDVQVIHGDFTQPLELPPLDGILIANALHFVRRQESVLRQLTTYLHPGGRILVVEYAVSMPRSYIPFPLSYPRFEKIALNAGLVNVQQVATRQSPSSGTAMYAAIANSLNNR